MFPTLVVFSFCLSQTDLRAVTNNHIALIMNTSPSVSIIGALCCFQKLFTVEEEARWKRVESNRENRPIRAFLPLHLISDIFFCRPRLLSYTNHAKNYFGQLRFGLRGREDERR